jgi:hypothetical protein
MLRAVAGVMLLLLGTLTLLGMLAAPWVVRLMAPGFFANPAVGELTVRMTRLMFPYLFFVGLSALAMGVLNAHRHFLLPALSPVALNVGSSSGGARARLPARGRARGGRLGRPASYSPGPVAGSAACWRAAVDFGTLRSAGSSG